jgi:hypothetical protein
MFDQDPQYPFPGPMLYEESGLGLGCVKSRRREKLMEQISLSELSTIAPVVQQDAVVDVLITGQQERRRVVR